MRLGASGSEGLEPYYYSVLFHPISPDLAPSDYHLSPGLKKTIQKSPFFVRRGGHYCRGDPVGRTTFWIIFCVAGKSQSNGLRNVLSFVVEYVE